MTNTANGAQPTANGTKLTAHGSRVPTLALPPTRKAVPAASTTNSTTAPRPSAAGWPQQGQSSPTVQPSATIRTMIVLLPDAFPQEPLTATALDRNFGVHGVLQARFWAIPQLRPWQRSRMVMLRKGSPATCAGGPVRLLDLNGLKQAAGIGAGIRHQVWNTAVQGTRPAYAWHQYLAKHHADPTGYTWEDAERDFHAQPRVTAMRMHNAVNPTAGYLDLAEVEMFQAGQVAYQHHSAATAICGDAMLRDDGARIAPASDALTDRATFIDRALRAFDALDPEQRLIAVAL
jgi:hypothetical protein